LSYGIKLKTNFLPLIIVVLGYAKCENGRSLQNTKGNVEDLSSEVEGDIRSTKNTDKQIQWRRTKVLELSSQGNTQSDIAKTLHVGEATVSRDISSLRQQAQINLRTHINDKLPEEYQNCMTGINQVLKICWEIVNKSRNMNNDNGNGQTMTVIDNKTVLQALALINDCNKYKISFSYVL
jgi:predicted transcriptional regulator